MWTLTVGVGLIQWNDDLCAVDAVVVVVAGGEVKKSEDSLELEKVLWIDLLAGVVVKSNRPGSLPLTCGFQALGESNKSMLT